MVQLKFLRKASDAAAAQPAAAPVEQPPVPRDGPAPPGSAPAYGQAPPPYGQAAPAAPSEPALHVAPHSAAAEHRFEAMSQAVGDLDDRMKGLAGVMDVLRQEVATVGTRLKDGDDKFLRLLALLEGVQADSPFLERAGPPLGEDVAPAEAPRPPQARAEPPPLALPAAEAPPPSLAPRPKSPLIEVRPDGPPSVPAHPTVVPPGNLHEAVLMLEWAEMLLAAVERESFGHLLDWYQAIGWIDDAMKNRLMLYSRGLYAPAEEGAKAEAPGRSRRRGAATEPPPWRQDVDLHLRSLAFVARLSGRPADPEQLEEAIRQAVAIRTT